MTEARGPGGAGERAPQAPPPPADSGAGDTGRHDAVADRNAGVADHYSAVAAGYARHRPTYPAGLFEWLSALAPAPRLAWDCGCGSGQATIGLADRFDEVLATDPSAAQLRLAPARPNITYRVGREADSGLPPGAVALVAAAQAAHWFDLAAFYREADRVLAPGGVLAIWSYGAPSVGPEIDPLLDAFRLERIGRYWPPGREHVDDGYRALPFPWAELTAPALGIEADWDLPALLGYVRSWSAVARYRAAESVDPVRGLEAALAPLWGGPATVRRIRWPIAMRAGRKPEGAGAAGA